MKPVYGTLLLTLALSAGPVAAATAPITLTVKNYRTLTNNLAKIVEAAAPGQSAGAVFGLHAGLGITSMKGIDQERPWQVQVWTEGGSSRPDISVWIPTTDFEAFKGGLEDGALKGDGNPIRQAGTYAGVWMEGSAGGTTAKSAHEAWKPEAVGTPGKAMQLALLPNEPLRQSLLQGLGGMRMMITGAVASQGAGQMPGLDPKALAELLGVYFDVFEVVLKGVDQLNLNLDLQGETLTVQKQVQAKAGSDLAGWLKSSPGSLDSVLPYAGGSAPIAFGLRWGDSPGFLPTLKKFMRLSMQMQGMAADDTATIEETEKMIDQMFPLKAAGVVEVKSGLAFSGVYQFPGRDADALYRTMLRFVDRTMQSQAGEGKPYKSIKLEEGKRTVGGTKVDRATMEVNFDAPLYKMPGQREVIESMWPGGRMEFEYARQGDNVLFASPDLMERLLTGAPRASAPGLALNSRTVGFARLNVVQILPMILGANPMVPDEVKERAKTIDPAGTEVTLRVDLDGSMLAEAGVPLKLIQSIRKLGND